MKQFSYNSVYSDVLILVVSLGLLVHEEPSDKYNQQRECSPDEQNESVEQGHGHDHALDVSLEHIQEQHAKEAGCIHQVEDERWETVFVDRHAAYHAHIEGEVIEFVDEFIVELANHYELDKTNHFHEEETF